MLNIFEFWPFAAYSNTNIYQRHAYRLTYLHKSCRTFALFSPKWGKTKFNKAYRQPNQQEQSGVSSCRIYYIQVYIQIDGISKIWFLYVKTVTEICMNKKKSLELNRSRILVYSFFKCDLGKCLHSGSNLEV